MLKEGRVRANSISHLAIAAFKMNSPVRFECVSVALTVLPAHTSFGKTQLESPSAQPCVSSNIDRNQEPTCKD